MKLSIELIPKPSWGKNVRSMTSPERWDMIRQQVYDNAGHMCEICKDNNTKLHAHEVWSYNLQTEIQTLTNIIALCEKCHLVKHFGYANISGKRNIAMKQLIKINSLTEIEALNHIAEHTVNWQIRSKINWKIDISYIDTFSGKINQE